MTTSTDAPLRIRFWRLTLIPLAVGILAVIVLLTPVRSQSRVMDAVMDLGHAPLFGGIAFYLLFSIQRIAPRSPLSRASIGRSALVALVLTAIGLLTEWLQQYFGRTSALHDAGANSLGVLAAVLIFLAWQIRRQQRPARWTWRYMLLAAGFLLSIACYRPFMTLRDVYIMHRSFPLLASFESVQEFDRFFIRAGTARQSRSYASDGRYSMDLLVIPSPHPAITMVGLLPDWSELRTLELDVTLDEKHAAEPVRLRLQVIDQAIDNRSEMFRREWILEPGRPQHLQVTRQEILASAVHRELDLSRVRFVDLAVPNITEPTRIYVDRIKLTR